jgi:single-strand DNA-binding protein
MEAFVHMTGYVGGDVEVRGSTSTIASFRLACTPRVRRGGDWIDGQTTWLSVTCFRSLADHALASIKKGDPVIVVGKLRTSVYEKNGEIVERLSLEATTVGHDLTRGTADFRRAERASVIDDREAEIAALIDAVESQDRDDDLTEPSWAGRASQAV